MKFVVSYDIRYVDDWDVVRYSRRTVNLFNASEVADFLPDYEYQAEHGNVKNLKVVNEEEG